jgi:hypothetical protein
MFTQQPFKETLCSLPITSFLQEHINHSTVFSGSPQVMLLVIDLHKYFINKEGISISLMFSSQTLSILGP